MRQSVTWLVPVLLIDLAMSPTTRAKGPLLSLACYRAHGGKQATRILIHLLNSSFSIVRLEPFQRNIYWFATHLACLSDLSNQEVRKPSMVLWAHPHHLSHSPCGLLSPTPQSVLAKLLDIIVCWKHVAAGWKLNRIGPEDASRHRCVWVASLAVHDLLRLHVEASGESSPAVPSF